MKKTLPILLLFICVFATSCFSLTQKEKEYYIDKAQYVEATGKVSHVRYNEEKHSLYLGFTELNCTFDDNSFKIEGANYDIVKSKGVEINTGDTITFMTAPKYFGDGYIMPIVAVWKNGECLLDFETGYKNLNKSLGNKI